MWPSGGQKLMAMTPAAEKLSGCAKVLHNQQFMFTKTQILSYRMQMVHTYGMHVHTWCTHRHKSLLMRCLMSCRHKLLTMLSSRLTSKVQRARNSDKQVYNV